MKKKGLAAAIDARKSMKDAKPEPKPTTNNQQPTIVKGAQRFHTSVYPEKGFYDLVKIALIQEGQGRDFNRLVIDLLQDWMEDRSK